MSTRFLHISSYLYLGLLSVCIPDSEVNQQATPSRPSILFVYTDDQAPWALGISGNAEARTPNMDRLAREGAYLGNAFVTTPVCSPSRAGLLASRYSAELGILDFIPHPKHRLYTPDTADIGLDPKIVTFVEVLAQAGYTNGLIGKWHVSSSTQSKAGVFHPTNHGYHYFMGLTGGGTSPENPTLEEEGVAREYRGLTTDILTDHALDFIERNFEKPFLLSLHYRAPHRPWLPVAETDWAALEDLDPTIPNPDYPDLDVDKVQRWTREYLASVHGVDRNLGRLLSALDDLGIADNTIVIFTSDHGYNLGHNGIYHKGNGIWMTKTLPPATENIASKYRPNLYDKSLRVPTMVRWPGVIAPGTVVTETISNLDWYPTLLAMAGAAPPAGETIRGRDFLPLLKGEKIDDWDNDLYAEYSMIHYSRTHMRAYRTPEWKLVRDFLNPERDELYNLVEDPAENTNLIEDPGPKARQMIDHLHAKIIENMRRTGDPVLKLAIR